MSGRRIWILLVRRNGNRIRLNRDLRRRVFRRECGLAYFQPAPADGNAFFGYFVHIPKLAVFSLAGSDLVFPVGKDRNVAARCADKN